MRILPKNQIHVILFRGDILRGEFFEYFFELYGRFCMRIDMKVKFCFNFFFSLEGEGGALSRSIERPGKLGDFFLSNSTVDFT